MEDRILIEEKAPKLQALRERESRRFEELRPRGVGELRRARERMPSGVPMSWMSNLYDHPPVVVSGGAGQTFTDIDGNRYVDFNLADTSMFCGYGNEAVAKAVGERMATGSQFLLPTEDAAALADELARRFGLPAWQFTLSATQANVEAVRVARAVTGRPRVLMFEGKYHGHADELLGEAAADGVRPEERGILPDALRHVRIVPYNDLEAVERELAGGEVAAVLAEAAITNAGVIMPTAGFHAGLRRLTSAAGTLLIYDETHTLAAGPGGLTGRWALEPDLLVLGKSISGGIALGAWGMTAPIAAELDDPAAAWGEGIATGGTFFANALSMAAARVTLEQVLTDDVYERAADLGARVADGIEEVAGDHGLDWSAHRLFNRSGYTHGPELPTNAAEASASFDVGLFNLQRLYMANRGIWEAIYSAGPACGTETTGAQVDLYLEVLDAFLGELTTAQS